MKRSKTVDEYIECAQHWQPELIRLREILQSTKLVETVKWGSPCYVHKDKPVVVPPELKGALAENKRAQAAFKELTKGKQREYAEYIADAKRDETKAKRIAKILPMIAAGVGLNDKYR